MANPVRIAITGAAGQICYTLLPRIASGEMLGPDRKVILQLIEIPDAMDALHGVRMEMEDCAFPLLDQMILTDDAEEGFRDANIALLVGASPRGKGQERGDLIKDNGPIFVEQGQAIANVAADDIRVIAVGNPVNTNALIAMNNAKGVPAERFSAMTRLDENRAIAQLALKAGVGFGDITNMGVWGNHSSTQYPDFEHALVDGRPAHEVIDRDWLENEFVETIQQRGSQIIEARGKSSAMSAGNALIDHVRDLIGGMPTREGTWVSMGVPSDGSYDVPQGLISSFPVVTDGQGNWEIVQGIELSDYAKERIRASIEELEEEREVISDLL